MLSCVLALAAAPAGNATAAPGSLIVLLGSAFDGDGHPLVATRLDIEAGRIARVVHVDAVAAPPPAGTRILDARARVVVPGFIDLRSGAGLGARNEEGVEIAGSLRALDLVDGGSLDFPRALASGVTTVLVSPGGRSVIGGLAAALKTDARPLDERVVSAEAGLVLTLGTEPTWGNRLSRFQTPSGLYFRRPGTRMGVIAEIRRAFGAGAASDAALRAARAGSIPLLWRAQVDQDIRTALRLSEELGLPRPILVNPIEGHRLPELLAGTEGVIVGPFYQMPRRLIEGIEGEDFRAATPGILAEAGVSVAIGTGPDDPPSALRDRAILAARAGLSPDLALAAITGIPARLLRLPHLGHLAVGSAGDLVVLDGQPLSPASRVLCVVVDGRLAWTHPEFTP
jgi:imidazolonepropionase-like amidohydrolase